MKKTLITISFDFELAWGYLENGAWKTRENDGVYSRTREVLPELFETLRKLNVRSTWGVVGGMLAENPAAIPLKHLPKAYGDSVSRFLDEARVDSWDGRDLCEKLAGYQDVIEIASHTHTHCYAECPGMSSEAYVTDVRLGIEAVEKYTGASVTSHIFTRDQADYRKALASWRPMRMRVGPSFYNPPANALERKIKGISKLFSPPVESSSYLGDWGENYQRGSVYFNWAGASYPVLRRAILRKQLKSVERLLGKTDDHYHFWLHPFNLCESNDLLREFNRFVSLLSDAQREGLCQTLTMSESGFLDETLWSLQCNISR